MRKLKSSYVVGLCCIALLFSVVIQPFFGRVTQEKGTNNFGFVMEKISPDIITKSDRKDDKYLVMVLREDIDSGVIEEEVYKKTGKSLATYENRLLFNTVVAKSIEESVVNTYGEEKAYEKITGFPTDEDINLVDLAIQEEYNDYISSKRLATKSLYQNKNDVFVHDLSLNADDIVYVGKFTSTLILYANGEMIFRLATNNDVQCILPFADGSISTDMTESIYSEVNVDSTYGTKSSEYNNGVGYKGAGIIIGIIESRMGVYDPTSPHLSSKHNNTLSTVSYSYRKYLNSSSPDYTDYTSPQIVSQHATQVTSIITGQSVVVNGVTYEGVVPNATVYCASVVEIKEVIYALNALLEQEVTVVNISASEEADHYSRIDYELDRIIKNTGISVVVSAGNIDSDNQSSRIPRLAMAYNVITVGNLDTTTQISNGYAVSASSKYQDYVNGEGEPFIIGSKPDIVAPGVNIPYVNSANTVTYNSGTSFSAPIVTGIIAQMQQCDPTLKTSYTGVKAILCASANYDCIRSDSLINDSLVLREKSGAGLVDAAKAIDLIQASNAQTGSITVFSSGNSVSYNNKKTLSLTAGQELVVAMAFSRGDLILFNETYERAGNEVFLQVDQIEDNIDLIIKDANGNVVVSSVSERSNVEMIRYTIQTSGSYEIVALIDTVVGETGGKGIQVSLAWFVE